MDLKSIVLKKKIKFFAIWYQSSLDPSKGGKLLSLGETGEEIIYRN